METKSIIKELKGDNLRMEKPSLCCNGWAICMSIVVYVLICIGILIPWIVKCDCFRGLTLMSLLLSIVVVIAFSVLEYMLLKALLTARKEALEAYRKEEMKLARVYEEVLELHLKQAKDQYEDERKSKEVDKWTEDTKRRIDNQRVNTYIEVLKKTGANDGLFNEVKDFVDKLWKKE
jgi:hypothetical protein